MLAIAGETAGPYGLTFLREPLSTPGLTKDKKMQKKNNFIKNITIPRATPGTSAIAFYMFYKMNFNVVPYISNSTKYLIYFNLSDTSLMKYNQYLYNNINDK